LRDLKSGGEIMRTKYRIIPSINNNQSLTIHPSTAKKLGIEYRKVSYFRFGVNCQEVKIILSNEIDSQDIILDNEIIQVLGIPVFASYEIVIKGYEIILGPYIGILIHKTEETLDKNINVYSNYLYDYETIGGVTLVFSIEGIKMKSENISGYVFNPQTKQWEKGIYPYPAALFKRIGTKKNIRNHMHKVIGDAIFNEYILDKWEVHEWLSDFLDLKAYLPDSILYNNINNLKNHVRLYEKIYIKPIHGSQGIGIIELTREEEKFIIKLAEEGKTNTVSFENEDDMYEYLKPLLKKGKFMLQRGINLIHTNKRKNDFRLLVVKDNDGIWKDYGMIVRHGVAGSIISNISGGGTAQVGESYLKEHLKLSEQEAYVLRREISTVAVKTAQAIEACGINCGNLGIDMGLDENKHIWIIEVNNKDPNHTIAIDAKEYQMFYSIKRANMLYAKRLAGF
jgi:glutathione synthase/RimK-type ligase-like ATP-grasp enzyme